MTSPLAGVPDGAGGGYLLWWDSRSTSDASHAYITTLGVHRVLRFTDAGVPAPGWPATGVPVTDTPSVQYETQWCVSDGSGGVIDGWIDNRQFESVLRVQRIDPAGHLLWGAAGVPAVPASETFANIDIAADGAGGVIVSYDRPLDPDWNQVEFVLRHLGPDGAEWPGWPAGGKVLATCPGSCYPGASKILPAGDGEVILVGPKGEFVQKFSPDGIARWAPAAGVPLPVQYDVHAVADGAGGVIVVGRELDGLDHAHRVRTSGAQAWDATGFVLPEQRIADVTEDGRGGVLVGLVTLRSPTQFDLYVQRLDSLGTIAPGWQPDSGSVACEGPGNRSWPLVRADGAGGAFIAWIDNDDGSVHAQHMDGSGSALWAASGATAGGLALDYPEMVAPDGSGGLVITWRSPTALGPEDLDRGTPWPVRGQRLDASGSPLWTPDGYWLLQSDSDRQHRPVVVPDGSGGATLVWQQFSGTDWNIAASHVDPSGSPQSPAAVVCDAVFDQARPEAVPDGAGGAIVAWLDWRSGGSPQLFAQRLDASGAPQWLSGGIAVGASGWSNWIETWLVADGAGGAFVASDLDYGVFVRRLDHDGHLAWPEPGVALANTYSFDFDFKPDGAGGLLAVWMDIVPDTQVVTAQRIDASGQLLWGASGARAGGLTEWQFPFEFRVAPDGGGGALVTWLGQGNGPNAVFAQHLTPIGVPALGWTPEGVLVSTASTAVRMPRIVPDATGEPLVAWEDVRGPQAVVYGQHFDGAGAPLWTAGGIPLSDGTGDQRLSGAGPDGSGGMVLTWVDGRGADWDVFAQRVDAAGQRLWGSGGVAACASAGTQSDPALGCEAGGGAIIAWQDSRDLPVDRVLVQRISPGGTSLWTNGGVISTRISLVSAEALAGRVRLVWDAGRPAMAATLERRTNGGEWRWRAALASDGSGRIMYEDANVAAGERYGYRLAIAGSAQRFGAVDVDIPPAARFALEGVQENPVRGRLLVRFSLASAEPATLEVFDVAGRRVLVRRLEASAAGAHVTDLGSLPDVRPGAYTLRLSQAGRTATRRFALLR